MAPGHDQGLWSDYARQRKVENDMKRFSILVDFNRASQTTRFQLRNNQGCRPGRRAATPSRPARVYVAYFTAEAVERGAFYFDMLREELEREVN